MKTKTIAPSPALEIAIRATGGNARPASSWSEEDRVLISAASLAAAREWLARHPEVLNVDSRVPSFSPALVWSLQARARRKRAAERLGKRVTHAKWVRYGLA